MINKTTKRLLSASRLGINFDYGHGHRWIHFYMDEVFNTRPMYDIIVELKICPDKKIYGNIIDCLNYIDFILKKANLPTLEEHFNLYNDWGLDDEFVNGDINWEDSGSETDDYFETCI